MDKKSFEVNNSPSPDGRGNPFFGLAAFWRMGARKKIETDSGNQLPKKNTILHGLFRYIYATKINLCSFPKVETQPAGLSFSSPF